LFGSLLGAGCSGDSGNSGPGPSPIGPPAADAPVYYTAIGASDANGVGASVPCFTFTTCEGSTGYVGVLALRLRTGTRRVTVMNLGVPAAVLSPAMQAIGRQHGREITGNFVDDQLPLVPRQSTLITIFGGASDANAIGEAIENGAAGSDVAGYIERQQRAFGADFDRLISGVRARAADSFVVVINVPNMALLPYAMRYPIEHRRVLQALSIAFSREANRQQARGVAILDAMCDADLYNRSHFAGDGFHPNDAGYAHIAARLLTVVNAGGTPPSASCAPMTAVP
jgi:lysophospholipase L1-like esterase